MPSLTCIGPVDWRYMLGCASEINIVPHSYYLFGQEKCSCIIFEQVHILVNSYYGEYFI